MSTTVYSTLKISFNAKIDFKMSTLSHFCTVIFPGGSELSQ